MSIRRRIGMWFVALVRPDRLEYDLDREMRFHLDMEMEANVRRGLSPEAARRQALLAFGGVDRHKDRRATSEVHVSSRVSWPSFGSRSVAFA